MPRCLGAAEQLFSVFVCLPQTSCVSSRASAVLPLRLLSGVPVSYMPAPSTSMPSYMPCDFPPITGLACPDLSLQTNHTL